MIPFARAPQERIASKDPRPSLQERYGSHAGYVAAVNQGAMRTVAEKFLLPVNATELIMAAQACAVLR